MAEELAAEHIVKVEKTIVNMLLQLKDIRHCVSEQNSREAVNKCISLEPIVRELMEYLEQEQKHLPSHTPSQSTTELLAERSFQDIGTYIQKHLLIDFLRLTKDALAQGVSDPADDLILQLDLALKKIVDELRTLDELLKQVDQSQLPLRRQESLRHFNLIKQPKPIAAKEPVFLNPGKFTTIRIEDGENKKDLILSPDPDQSPNIPVDIYKQHFVPFKHSAYVVQPEKAAAADRFIVTVLFDEKNKVFKFLEISKRGTVHRGLEESFFKSKLDFKNRFASQNQQIKSILSSHFYPNATVYRLTNPSALSTLTTIEQKHPQDNFRCFKIGVVYAKADQNDVPSYFSNKTGSPEFQKFLSYLGKEIDLSSWNDYRGDMGKTGKGYFREWKNCKFIFHVSTELTPEQHRRLIGNDIALIIFKEDTSFDLSSLDQFGAVPQIFSVVQPVSANKKLFFRLGFASRKNLKPFGPNLFGENHYFDMAEQNGANFLFSKMVNGYLEAFRSPPLNRLFVTPRENSLQNLIEQFPHENKQQIKKRNKSTSLVGTRILNINVHQCRNLAVRDELIGSSDPFVKVKLGNLKKKTQVIKENLNPQFDTQMVWNIIETESNELMKFEVWDWNLLESADFIGSVSFPLHTIVKEYCGKGPVWFQLQDTRSANFKKIIFSRENEKLGEIQLSFEVQEPKEG